MKKIQLLFACILAVALMACGSGKNQKANAEQQSASATGEKYDLYYKLEQGETYSQKIAMDMDMTISAMGQEMEMGITMDMAMDMTVTDVTDDGFTCDAQFTEVAMGVSGMMGNVTYSSNDDSGDPMAKMLQGMTKGKFTMAMTKHGKVTSMTGFEEMMDNMYGSMGLSPSELAQAKAMMEQGFSEDKMMEQMQNMAIYPDYPVAIGDSWEVAASTSQMTVENTYTLEEMSDDEAVITVSSIVKAEAMDGFDGTIEGTQNGTIVARPATGWVKHAEIKQDISGEGKIQGVDGKIKMNSTITMTE